MPGWPLYIIAVVLWLPRPWTVTVTAYCPCVECCYAGIDTADGMTASGIPALGPIVAAPKSIPFGTIIFIPGYGLATVQDRGGSIRGDRLDVLFPSHRAALSWGRKRLTVLIWR